MDQPILKQFGGPISRVEKALNSLRKGQGVLVTDNADRENEGDLIFAAQTLTNEQMAMLIRECSGIVCLCLTEEKIRSLGLPMMVEKNNSQYQTAFTVSIEAAEGVTTGVSAKDRVATVKAAIAADAKSSDLARPGHVFPLCARPGGVLERGGHTEATVDLTRLAGLMPCGVLCELTNPDGTMAKLHEIVGFAIKNQMAMCTVQDIVAYREHIGDTDAEMVVPEDVSAVVKPTKRFPTGAVGGSVYASGR
ncbi:MULTISPECIES: 3,4-dihydroxy-2-butanone-4-phosphate synthase [unclassified Pseudodesulfovibrio]|uniref:3,4-dihydroxy-2-butanone-4-phosphate synthase n=1 Tax=unclassified Pseudodesulfovibrio TaxID=2661612 RepID=UPI000FEC1AC6|nr:MULTISPECIES: 3,4-dihydroxy-2-butanone-4-phosphate synthase [unclassified Pseudodesulfovibrio]MCJ2165373.1 3,4-dihydroxy-2-butanone-4-phosphate synthase [Pseudodesulfovibrio sp. S3-i]RWU02851.1 3,4-dihydroxy-2-butanone-4-phosphate synthase [Pseudodesulfovibrio sp. S3]